MNKPRWTKDELELLQELMSKGIVDKDSIIMLANTTGRTPKAIKCKIRTMGGRAEATDNVDMKVVREVELLHERIRRISNSINDLSAELIEVSKEVDLLESWARDTLLLKQKLSYSVERDGTISFKR